MSQIKTSMTVLLPHNSVTTKSALYFTALSTISGFINPIDCAGSNPYSTEHPALIEGFQYLLKGGTLLGIGTYFHPIAFVPAQILVNEYMLINSYLYNNADVLRLKEIVTSLKTDFSLFIDDVQLEQIIEHGYYRAEVDKDSFTRLVVKC